MQPLHSLALTGGPSGGKSTLIRAVAEQVPEAYYAPEVATMLLSGGFPAPSLKHPWDESWQIDLQQGIAGTQLALENIARRRAIKEGKRLVIFDRGIIDGAAYLPNGIFDLESMTGLTEEEMLRRYNTVLHLASTAISGSYDKQSNPHRFEEAEEALKLEDMTLEAWQNHPSRIILKDADKQIKISKGLSYIKNLINVE